MRELTVEDIEQVSGAEYTWNQFGPYVGLAYSTYAGNVLATATGLPGALGSLGGGLAFGAGYLTGSTIYSSYGSSPSFINAADSFFGGIDYVRNNWWNG